MLRDHGRQRSQAIFERAQRVLPGGVTRTTISFSDAPTYLQSGQGAYVTDEDGNRLLDFANNFTTLIHGHAHPEITRRVQEQTQLGTCFSNPTASEVDLAETICGRVPGIDQIRFVNTGTEAVMFAIKAARTLTGRSRIAKFQGGYHGAYDWAEVSEKARPGDNSTHAIPNYKGTPASVLTEVLPLPFNDIAGTKHLLETAGGDLAAILVDVMPSRPGLIPLDPDYITLLNQYSAATGTILISDEVLNFRLAYGGAAQAAGLEARIFALGKIIGGGFPIGAIGGRSDVMHVFNSRVHQDLPQGGTFAANPVSMVAGQVSLDLLTREALADLSRYGDQVRNGIAALARTQGYNISVTGQGSLFRLHPKAPAPVDYASFHQTSEERRQIAGIVDGLQARGVLISNTGLGALSTPMQDAEIYKFLSALEDTLKEIY